MITIQSAIDRLDRLLPPPLKEVLSEDGVGSYSRYTGFLAIVAVLLWVTYIVLHDKHIPELTGPIAFMTSAQTGYAINQVKKVTAVVKGTDNGGVTNGPQS